jgi:HEAT repeat protein
MSDDAQPEPEASGEEAQRQTTPFLVLQFFVFPMSIVAVCVAVFVIFGLIASEQKAPRDYLTDVRIGGGLNSVKRWQAAFALAGTLASDKNVSKKDPEFANDLVKLFRESKEDDPRVRRYLAVSMGRLGDPRVLPALLEVLREDPGGQDPDTLVYSIWAAGVIGDPAVVPELLRLAKGDDAGVRKTALHALGPFAGEAPAAALAEGLTDPVADVRWNAAIALAHRRDAAATPVLRRMLDRSELAATPGITPEQQEEALVAALAAAGASGDASLRAPVQALLDHDPSPVVRQAAQKALDPAASQP